MPPKREMPAYDNRAPAPETAGDVALYVPRAIFRPAYVVSEYILRRPLAWLITKAEKDQWQVALLDFFAFGPDHKAGIVPTALVDFGLKPSVGLYAFWDDFLVKDNALRATFGTWGPHWISLGLLDRFPAGPGTMAVVGSLVHRPDHPFFGIGPRSLERNESRYESTVLDGGIEYHLPLFGLSQLVTRVGARHRSFDLGSCCGDPSIQDSVAAGRFAEPEGFGQSYSLGYQRIELDLDSRQKVPASQSGVRLVVQEEQDFNAASNSGNAWIQWGGTLGGYLDVGRARVFDLKVTALFADPLHGGEIPFTEQVSLGGLGPMRGYLFGRLVDRSALIAELEYRWPIWVFLDGTMHVAMGNVFGTHLNDFEANLLRLSSGIGVRTSGSPDHSFEFLTGFGTETLQDGLKVDSFRLVFGGTRGF